MTGLEDAGRRVKEAEALRESAMADLRKDIVAARREGTPVMQIARRAGVSRQTVYTILAEAAS